MMTKRLFSMAIVTAVALAVCTESQGGIAVSKLKGGKVNRLEDTDNETLINKDGGTDTTLDDGDYLVGMFEITKLFAPPNTQVASLTTSTFTGVFVLQVDGAPVFDGTNYNYTFKSAASADTIWADLGLTRVNTDTAMVMYEDNSPDGSTGFFTDPNMGTVALSLGTAADGTPLYEFGFKGDAGEFWNAQASSTDVTNNSLAVQFGAALNVTNDYLNGPLLDKFNYLSGQPGPFQTDFTDPTQLQLTGNINLLTGNTLPVQTNTQLFISPVVPEASSILIWSVLGLIGGGVSLRRARGRAVAA